MIWLAIWLGVVVFAFQGAFLDPIMKPDSLGGYFFMSIFYLLICAFVALLCGGAAYGIGELYSSHPVEGEHRQLEVIRDKDGMQGRFFLGSGTIESQPYYFYYQRMEDGGLRPGKLEANHFVTVYEEDRKNAELVVFDWVMSPPWWAWIICAPHSESDGKSYEFHVPKGTVKPGYQM